jgi:hypothetical protein
VWRELVHDQVGAGVVDRGAEEDDPAGEQPRVQVEGALAPAGLLDDDGHEIRHAASSDVRQPVTPVLRRPTVPHHGTRTAGFRYRPTYK